MPVTRLERLANNAALIRLTFCHGGRRMSAWPAFLKRGCWLAIKERISTGPRGGTPAALSRKAGRPQYIWTASRPTNGQSPARSLATRRPLARR